MKLYNTLTKKEEEFKPIAQPDDGQKPKVKFYHCGPTVYWTQHIGNLRAMTMGDLIRRSLDYVGYDVNYVRNYTDVGHLTSDADEGEDKMEKGAKREGKTPDEIAKKYIDIFENDIKEINLLDPTNKARVTEYIPEIIEMVQILIEKGAAYITPKAVYFDVTKAKDYPAFSNKKIDDQEQIVGAGAGDVTDPNKKHPADFALWFFKTGAHKNAIQVWESPFSQPANTSESEKVEKGLGFPGWHIECSVIAEQFLGETLDIHMGGVEHIPIHHPNEIAQSEAAHGAKFVNYWLHNEHLNVNDRKMSKSEGTGYSLAEIKEKGFDPMDLRYFFLQAHYRSKQNFTWGALKAARTARENLKMKILNIFHNTKSTKHEIDNNWNDKFIKALENDVNIPQALALLWDMLKSPNEKTYSTVLEFDKVLGLGIQNWKPEKEKLVASAEIDTLIKAREQARKDKDYQKADEIRKELEGKYGVEIKDTSTGTEYHAK